MATAMKRRWKLQHLNITKEYDKSWSANTFGKKSIPYKYIRFAIHQVHRWHCKMDKETYGGCLCEERTTNSSKCTKISIPNLTLEDCTPAGKKTGGPLLGECGSYCLERVFRNASEKGKLLR